MLEPGRGFAETAIDDGAEVQPGGVDDDGVGGGTERRDGPLAVVLVATELVREHVLQGDGEALLRQLAEAALGARLVAGSEKKLRLRAGKDAGAEVAPLWAGPFSSRGPASPRRADRLR